MSRKEPESSYQLFMLVLCVFSLVLFGVDTLAPLDPEVRQILRYADAAVCVFFLYDFLLSLKAAQDRWRYILTWGWIDLVSSIPTVGILRVGRAARVARIVRVLRGFRSARVLMQHTLKRRAESAVLGALLGTLVVIFFASIAIVHVERAAGGNIVTGRDALWWSVVTVSTAGFGDFYPVTTEGRLIAAGLMATGVGLFGSFTAFLASWFLKPEDKELSQSLAQVQAELADVKRLLERRDNA